MGCFEEGERIETSRINIERSWALGATGVLIVGHEGVGLPLGGDPFGEARGHCLIDILGHHVVSKLPAFLHENKSTSMKWRLACMLLTCVPSISLIVRQRSFGRFGVVLFRFTGWVPPIYP
jgi:hypothetical protein